MSVEIWKIEKNLCRCCHSEGTFDSLAGPKQISDHEEIYCNMLKECFNVQIIPVPGELCDSTYSICNACILRLRDASSFKKQVLCCERRFMDLYLNNAIKVKEEDAETVADFKEVYINPDEDNDEEYVIKEDEDNQESDAELNLTLKNRKNVKQKIKKLKCKRKDELKKTNNSKTKGKKDCWRMKMPRKSNITKNGVRKYGMKSNYSPGALERALNEIKSGALTRIQASKKYKIPPVTLYYKVNEKHSKSIGRPLALTESEEESFKTHLSLLCDLGIPINMRDFRVIAKKYLDSENKKIKQFHNNMPGYEWGTLFLERHPDLKVKIANNIHRKRAHVSCKQIEAFFTNLEKDIEGIPPENIFNMTESGFHDDPSKKNLLFRRDSRHPELIKNATKSCYTVTFCVNAAGDTLPPFFIFKGKKLRSDWLALAPQDSRMAVSDSGWITTEVFEEWLEMHFIPSVRKLEGKKMLFCDYLSAHISPKVLRLCEEYNIVFTCLTPKSNLVQPFDVGYLFSVKSNWRKVLNNYRRTCRGKKQMALPKCLFAQLMRKTLEIGEASRVDNIKAGFRSSGLYPFSPKTVLNKLPNYTLESYERESVDKVFDRCIGEVRSPDLSSATKRKKLQSPITVGKNVSAEEITKYYEENAKSQDKGTKSSSMKRGRPAGSKNRKKKKAIPTEDEDDRIPINSDLLQDEDAYIVVVEADAQGIESPSQILRDAISYTIESKGNESQDQETEDDDIDLDLSEDNLYSEG